MTENQTTILMLALQNSGRLHYRAAYDIMGENAWAVLNTLKLAGAVDHPGYDDWRLTERGRIAAALAMHKDRNLARRFGIGLSPEAIVETAALQTIHKH
jgi:Mn-dependent DtxR family transcriptional regulator